jgi:hypothetical protein
MLIKKLDKRNKGHEYFKYYIKTSYPVQTKDPDYHELRAWMWQTWGPSKELVDWIDDENEKHRLVTYRKNISCQNEHWCWQNDDYYSRLYLTGDDELVLFKLRWQ